MMRFGRRLFCILVALAASTVAAPADPVEGWSAGSEDDATMSIGQRITCDGAECAGGFVCLHAKAPPRPAGARWLKTDDVTNEAVWPWEAVEGWLGTKLNEIANDPIPDPSLPAARWARRDTPITFELGDESFARRIYMVSNPGRDLTVPIWFWTSEGRLSTIFCAIEGVRLSTVRGPIQALLSELHPGEPVRDDIPTRF